MKLHLQSMNDVSLCEPYIDRKGVGGTNNYIKFDRDNAFPQRLLKLVGDSPVQKSIMEALYTKLVGAMVNSPEGRPNLIEGWPELVRKCMRDFSIFETFAVQIVKNLDGKSYTIYHQPVSEVRLGKSEYGVNDINMAYICSDWTQAKTSKIKQIKMFGCEPPKQGEKYLAYFKQYMPQEIYYHIPSYWSAANWIAADGRISRYYNNFVANNLSTSKVIKYPMDMSEEEKEALYEGIREQFTGETAAGQFLLLFGDGSQMPEIDSLSTPDADLYNTLNSTIKENLITANRLSSPALAGIAMGASMSSQAEQLIAANVVYLNDVVLPMRTFVLSKLNALNMQLNGVTEPITIEDYDLRKEFDGLSVQNDNIEEEASTNE